jgi:ribonuclease VapC
MTIRRPAADDLVVDTSAIMAVLLAEPTASPIARALGAANSPIMSAPTLAELTILAEARCGEAGSAVLRSLLDDAEIDVFPISGPMAEHAAVAWRRFGRGRHPAALNYGDCFTYALASHSELPILCVGDDFARTDAEVVDLTRFA